MKRIHLEREKKCESVSRFLWFDRSSPCLPVTRGLSVLHVQSGDSSRRCLVLPLLAATSLTGIQAGLRGETASQIVAASLCLSLNPSSTLGGLEEKKKKVYNGYQRRHAKWDFEVGTFRGTMWEAKKQEVSCLVTIYLSGDAEKRVWHLLQPLTCTSREIRWHIGILRMSPRKVTMGLCAACFHGRADVCVPTASYVMLRLICEGMVSPRKPGNATAFSVATAVRWCQPGCLEASRGACLSWWHRHPPPQTHRDACVSEMCHKKSR